LQGHQSADAVEAAVASSAAPKKSLERLHSEKAGQQVLEQLADEEDDNAGAKVLIKYFEVSPLFSPDGAPLGHALQRAGSISRTAGTEG